MMHFFCIDAHFGKNYNKIIRDNEFVYLVTDRQDVFTLVIM